jgi:hypothetical protein
MLVAGSGFDTQCFILQFVELNVGSFRHNLREYRPGLVFLHRTRASHWAPWQQLPSEPDASLAASGSCRQRSDRLRLCFVVLPDHASCPRSMCAPPSPALWLGARRHLDVAVVGGDLLAFSPCCIWPRPSPMSRCWRRRRAGRALRVAHSARLWPYLELIPSPADPDSRGGFPNRLR